MELWQWLRSYAVRAGWPAMATAVSSRYAELLRLMREGEGEARRRNESAGGSRASVGVKWRAEARRGLTGWANGGDQPPRDSQFLSRLATDGRPDLAIIVRDPT